jgi:hypothetical protein
MNVDTENDLIPDEDVNHRPGCTGDACSCFDSVSLFSNDENIYRVPKKINKAHFDHYVLTAAHCLFSKLKMTDCAEDVQLRNQLSQNAKYTVYDSSMDAALLPVENHSDTHYHVGGTRLSDWSPHNYMLEQNFCVFKVGAIQSRCYDRNYFWDVDWCECHSRGTLCVEVTSRSNVPFCYSGDSGSVYYLIDHFDNYNIIPLANSQNQQREQELRIGFEVVGDGFDEKNGNRPKKRY